MGLLDLFRRGAEEILGGEDEAGPEPQRVRGLDRKLRKKIREYGRILAERREEMRILALKKKAEERGYTEKKQMALERLEEEIDREKEQQSQRGGN